MTKIVPQLLSDERLENLRSYVEKGTGFHGRVVDVVGELLGHIAALEKQLPEVEMLP